MGTMAKTQTTKKTTVKPKTVTKAAPKTAAKAAPKTVTKAAPKAKATAKVAKPVKRSAPAPSDIVRPTRNKTGYMMYVKEQRKATQEANPDMGFVEITKDIADRWNKLSEAELKPYNTMAAKDKARYEK